MKYSFGIALFIISPILSWGQSIEAVSEEISSIKGSINEMRYRLESTGATSILYSFAPYIDDISNRLTIINDDLISLDDLEKRISYLNSFVKMYEQICKEYAKRESLYQTALNSTYTQIAKLKHKELSMADEYLLKSACIRIKKKKNAYKYWLNETDIIKYKKGKDDKIVLIAMTLEDNKYKWYLHDKEWREKRSGFINERETEISFNNDNASMEKGFFLLTIENVLTNQVLIITSIHIR